jgi:flagellar biosynthesis anti-sigma factor FlgM
MTVSANTSISGSSQINQPDIQGSRRAQSSASSVEDQTRLSADQDQTQQLRAALAQQPEVRQERVAAVRQSLTDGSKQPSNEQIARAIVDEYSPT